jgi:hypothetical protein
MAEFDKPTALSYVKRLWLHGFLVGFAVVGLIMGAWFCLSGPSTPPSQEEVKTYSAPTQMEGSAEAPDSWALKPQMEEVLLKAECSGKEVPNTTLGQPQLRLSPNLG